MSWSAAGGGVGSSDRFERLEVQRGEFDEAIIQIQIMLLKLDPIFSRRDVLGQRAMGNGHSEDYRLSDHFQTELLY